MKVAIMQPYFFPYLGYFQLIRYVDTFVLLDDVSYINRGWINRNRINMHGKASYITLKLKEKSQNKLINEIKIFNSEKTKQDILHTITETYRKAPYYQEVFPILEEIILFPEENLSEYLTSIVKKLTTLLRIEKNIFTSSSIIYNRNQKGEQKIIEIAKYCNADIYVNPIGGKMLYSKENFRSAGLHLAFLEQGDIRYPQFSSTFTANLSIIDVLMFNDREKINEFLDIFSLY